MYSAARVKTITQPTLPNAMSYETDGFLFEIGDFRAMGYSSSVGVMGSISIAALTGRAKEVKRWRPTWKNWIRRVPETVREERWRYYFRGMLSASPDNLVDKISRGIARSYGEVLDKEWIKTALQPLSDDLKRYYEEVGEYLSCTGSLPRNVEPESLTFS